MNKELLKVSLRHKALFFDTPVVRSEHYETSAPTLALVSELRMLLKQVCPVFSVQLVPGAPVSELRLLLEQAGPVSAIQFSPRTLVLELRLLHKQV